MTTNKEMERIVRSWLEPGLTTLTDDVLDPVLDQLPATPQRRPVWPPRRIRYVGSFAKFSLAAAALVVVAIVGINLASRSGQPIVGNTPASPSPSVDSAIPPSDCTGLYPDGGTYRATVGPLGVTATMPAGWYGLRSQFLLVKAQCLFGGSLKLEVAMVTHVYTDACDWRGTAIEATTPAAVTNALSAQVGHETVGPTDVTIGGYPASRFEFSFPDDFDGDTACDDGTIWLFPGDPDPGIFNFDPGSTMTVYVVDVDGLTVAAVASFSTADTSADTTAANIAALDTIVDLLRFEPSEVQAVSPSPNASTSPSVAPAGSPAPIAPTSGAIEAGRYRWTSPDGDVTFDLPDGWTGTAYGIVKDAPTRIELAHYMPGSPDQVTHVYADACKSEGRLEPVDPLDGNANLMAAALENQAGTDAGTTWFNGPDGTTDPPVGQKVEIREEPGLDRSTCRDGAEGPLRIWADPEETTFFALAPGHWGAVYIFGQDGTPFVFSADFGPDATEADADEVDAIVQSFELSSR